MITAKRRASATIAFMEPSGMAKRTLHHFSGIANGRLNIQLHHERLLDCGISARPMTAVGQSHRIDTAVPGGQRPLHLQ
jgi:hypothetical protein